jgi:Cys-tRNA(Pro)/Cys-tRNA(Cys) deacylase
LFPHYAEPVARAATAVDASALHWDRVLCSAGKRGWDVALYPQVLIGLTNAVTADIRA